MGYNDVFHVTMTSIISYSSYNNKISQILAKLQYYIARSLSITRHVALQMFK